MPAKKSAIAALLLLTALNFLNYIDRNVLYAVQPLIQKEFHLDDAKIGFLTSAFFICYMVAAPLIGPLADRYPANGSWPREHSSGAARRCSARSLTTTTSCCCGT